MNLKERLYKEIEKAKKNKLNKLSVQILISPKESKKNNSKLSKIPKESHPDFFFENKILIQLNQDLYDYSFYKVCSEWDWIQIDFKDLDSQVSVAKSTSLLLSELELYLENPHFHDKENN